MNKHTIFLAIVLIFAGIFFSGFEKSEKPLRKKLKRSCAPVPRFENDCYDWDARYRLCCEQAKSRRADIVFIGDSITHFWDSAAEPSYGGPVWDKYFGGKNVLNIGFGWDRTPNVLWRLENGHFENQKPKFIVLNIGTNNFSGTENYPGDSPKDVADGVIAIIDKLQKLSPDSKIISMAIFPRADKELQNKVRRANRLLDARLRGRKNVIRLDLTKKLTTPDGNQIQAYFLDGCHLSNEGYEIWAQALKPILGI